MRCRARARARSRYARSRFSRPSAFACCGTRSTLTTVPAVQRLHVHMLRACVHVLACLCACVCAKAAKSLSGAATQRILYSRRPWSTACRCFVGWRGRAGWFVCVCVFTGRRVAFPYRRKVVKGDHWGGLRQGAGGANWARFDQELPVLGLLWPTLANIHHKLAHIGQILTSIDQPSSNFDRMSAPGAIVRQLWGGVTHIWGDCGARGDDKPFGARRAWVDYPFGSGCGLQDGCQKVVNTATPPSDAPSFTALWSTSSVGDFMEDPGPGPPRRAADTPVQCGRCSSNCGRGLTCLT